MCGVVDGGFVRSVLGSREPPRSNPMRWGSGTNLKMLDYARPVVPILSTRFGARGVGLEAGTHYEEAEDLTAGLRSLGALPAEALAQRTRAAAQRVRADFAWDVIAGLCIVVSADVVRYRPMLLVLAAGKAASSLAALGFYLFDSDVFAYLLNFLVDGLLVAVALLL